MIGRLAGAAGRLAGLAVLAMTLLITYDVLMRYLLGAPQLFVDELASLLQVVAIFFGLARTFRTGTHVRVDLVTGWLAGTTRARLRLATLALGAVFVLATAWVTLQSALSAWRQGRVSAVMLYPLWPAMAAIPLGLALLALAFLEALARQRHARHDESPPPDRV